MKEAGVTERAPYSNRSLAHISINKYWLLWKPLIPLRREMNAYERTLVAVRTFWWPSSFTLVCDAIRTIPSTRKVSDRLDFIVHHILATRGVTGKEKVKVLQKSALRTLVASVAFSWSSLQYWFLFFSGFLHGIYAGVRIWQSPISDEWLILIRAQSRAPNTCLGAGPS